MGRPCRTLAEYPSVTEFDEVAVPMAPLWRRFHGGRQRMHQCHAKPRCEEFGRAYEVGIPLGAPSDMLWGIRATESRRLA